MREEERNESGGKEEGVREERRECGGKEGMKVEGRRKEREGGKEGGMDGM